MYSFNDFTSSLRSQLADNFIKSPVTFNPWLMTVTVFVLLVLRRVTRPDPLSDIPGPWLAKYTLLPLGYYARTGKRYLYVDRLHKKYGPFVRISPNQVSCSNPAAPSIIYAQGSLALPKSAFYKSFYIRNTPSLFSTQERTGHAQKRRILAHPFSQSNVKQLEGWIRGSLRKMIRGLDNHCVNIIDVNQTNTVNIGGVRESATARGSNGRLVDLLMWLNYMTFDVISDLAFGEPLGMLDRASDVLEPNERGQQLVGVAASIDYRGRTAAFLGLFPCLISGSWLAPLVEWIPDKFIQRGFTGTDVHHRFTGPRRCVRKRLEAGSESRRGDILDRLMDPLAVGNTNGEVREADITTEAMLLLTAGSDTTANSTAAIMYWIVRSPRVMQKLRDEIDEAVLQLDHSVNDLLKIGDAESVDDGYEHAMLWYDQIKTSRYLRATMDEALRMFATNSFGLPRVVPEGMNVKIGDKTFHPGTELSVPAYTIQHDPAIWGDPEVFRPERWLEGDLERGDCEEGRQQGYKKYLLTFGMGPRACIGKK